MTIRSYFFDSVDGDRLYSASDFASAFGIGFETGVLIRESEGGNLGFDIGGTNYTTIYEGKAIIEGRFVEIIGTETVVVPAGSYSGQIVIRMDADDIRSAEIVVKTDQAPIQNVNFYELPLYNCTVSSGLITNVTDIRIQGGAVPNNHNHSVDQVEGLQTHIDKALTWTTDTNGVKCNMGKFAGTGKPVMLFLTSAQPSASSSEHRVWIQIDKF